MPSTRCRLAAVMIAMLALAGCNRDPAPPASLPGGSLLVLPEHAGAISYLALGDSYTIGEGVPAADRYPMQLAATLRSAGVDLSDPAILARTGWTSSELLRAMDRTPLAEHYDVVTLLIGVNNQFRGQALQLFRNDLQTLLDRAIKMTGRADRVIVVSIPDWGVTPFGQHSSGGNVAADIDQFNASCQELATAAKVRYVDVTAISRVDAGQADDFADDGLHPTGKQYAQWTAAIVPVMKAALTTR